MGILRGPVPRGPANSPVDSSWLFGRDNESEPEIQILSPQPELEMKDAAPSQFGRGFFWFGDDQIIDRHHRLTRSSRAILNERGDRTRAASATDGTSHIL